MSNCFMGLGLGRLENAEPPSPWKPNAGVGQPSLCLVEGAISSTKELIFRTGKTRVKWRQEGMQDFG